MVDLEKQIYMIESSLNAIKKNINKDMVYSKMGKMFLNNYMKEIYWRLNLIQDLINEKLRGVE